MSSDFNPWNSQPEAGQSGGAYSAQPSQSAASYPAQSQQSAYPVSQTSAYPASQGSAYPAAEPVSYASQADPTAAIPPQQQVGYVVQEKPTGGGNNIAALFDFGFKKFATRSIVKVSYFLTFLFALLVVWLGPVFMAFIFGAIGAGAASSYGSSSSGAGIMMVPAFLWLITGWIPAILIMIYARMVCEFFVLQQQAAESLHKLETK